MKKAIINPMKSANAALRCSATSAGTFAVPNVKAYRRGFLRCQRAPLRSSGSTAAFGDASTPAAGVTDIAHQIDQAVKDNKPNDISSLLNASTPEDQLAVLSKIQTLDPGASFGVSSAGQVEGASYQVPSSIFPGLSNNVVQVPLSLGSQQK
jgi:hypothetical protein